VNQAGFAVAEELAEVEASGIAAAAAVPKVLVG